MIKTAGEGVYTFELFGSAVTAAFSGRQFPESKRDDFLGELGIAPEKLVLVKQVHGDEIVFIPASQEQGTGKAALPVPCSQTEADALFTAVFYFF